jgi:hypothetical protein
MMISETSKKAGSGPGGAIGVGTLLSMISGTEAIGSACAAIAPIKIPTTKATIKDADFAKAVPLCALDDLRAGSGWDSCKSASVDNDTMSVHVACEIAHQEQYD